MQEYVVEEFTHNGCTIRILPDDDGEYANPRDDDGNVATLIQVADRYLDIDRDDAGLGEARDHFWDYGRRRYSSPKFPGRSHTHDRDDMVRRYIGMFRPDILFYEDSWSAGESYGWGYVTREDWDRWMGEDYDGEVTPQQAFAQEVEQYRMWAEGEVYGYVIYESEVDEDDDITVDDLTEVDSCWGFLGLEWAIESAREAAGFTCKHCGEDIARNLGPWMDYTGGEPWPWTHGRKMIVRTRDGVTEYWNRRIGYVTDQANADQYPGDTEKQFLPLGGTWLYIGRYVKCLDVTTMNSDAGTVAETDQPTGGKV